MKNIEGTRILIVEDNVLNQRIVTMILSRLGVVCTSAFNGEEAIEKLKDCTYDVILMDLNMPVMDGYETARYIRGTLCINTPIIAITADTFSAEDDHYKKDGINMLLTKPFDFDNFTDLVDDLIKKNA